MTPRFDPKRIERAAWEMLWLVLGLLVLAIGGLIWFFKGRP